MRIDALAANVVAVADIATTVVTDTSGTTSEQTHMHTEVWVKRDGRWIMLHSQESIRPESM
ncbi:MAG: hypothetical protein GTO22_03215 [Gemmatimonadales bacterium]|nr:hypothetical protein [Gemmatimonadales bacterium]